MSKYDPLQNHLAKLTNPHVPMTFSQIEELIADDLPNSARKHRPWWSNNPSNSVITYAWLKAGYKTTKVNLDAETLIFEKTENPMPQDTLHPLLNCLKGKIKVTVEVDLTAPTTDDWEATTLESHDRTAG